ncbi:sodium:solute symporter [Halococcus sp. IIIV-5B]|uniref:sodium:solute symporter family protein n=1 Tax=Halococcus sp. IIIV-5B TaxID=2321230 RepID=UPI000E75F2DC|nr:sodium:solute symporter family protein [Halococcus sp. IIIV-5B]RJT00209.1 sodium:solute symporter family protein [Halococcus sp. IIIV-5B]
MVNQVYLGAFIVYLLLVLGIGLWGYTRTKTKDDFWVYGRNLGKWLATWSLVANFFSAVAAIGVIGETSQVGYAILVGVNFGLALGISGLYFVSHKVRALDKVTLSDIVANVTGREYARPVTGAILFGNAWVYLIIQLVGASVLVTAITGVPYEYMVWVIGIVFIAYTVLGGLVSVAWTDLLQGTVIVALMTLTAAYLVVDLGGFTATNTQFAAIDPQNVTPLGGQYTLITIVSSILGFFGTIFTGQNVIIRINATKDVETTKFHLAAGGVIIGSFLVVTTVLGAATGVTLDNAGVTVTNTDRAFPILITEYMPTLIGTVVILGIMSAILSTTDTRLHALGVTVSRDIYDYFRPNTSDEHQLKVSRYATVVFGLLATAISANPPGTIFDLYSFRAVLLTTGLLLPVYVALYWRGFDGRVILVSMVLGGVVGVGTALAGGALFGVPATLLGVGVGALVLLVGRVVLYQVPTSQSTS